MKRFILWIFVVVAVAGCGPVYAEWYGSVSEGVTVSTTAPGVTLTSTTVPTPSPSLGNDAVRATMSLESYDARFTMAPSTSPGAAYGHVLTAGSYLTVTGRRNLLNFKILSTGAAAGKLQVTYELQK